MENVPANLQPSKLAGQTTPPQKTGFTPRELIYYHMQHPDKPISDDDIENLILVVSSSARSKNVFNNPVSVEEDITPIKNTNP